MIKYIIGTLLSIGIVLAVFYFVVGVPKVHKFDAIPQAIPYTYGDKTQSIRDIEVVALYFVPKDRIPVANEEWLPLLEVNLERLVDFHERQFLETSQVQYHVVPQAVIGAESGAAYDSDVTQHGDPRALELLKGELFGQADVVGLFSDRTFRVLLVMYEGTGATGSKNIALLSRSFFTREEDKPFTATFLAHEFYHALGAPDHYRTATKVFPDGQQASIEILTSEDIMGKVRVPIEGAYVDRETLQKFGL